VLYGNLLSLYTKAIETPQYLIKDFVMSENTRNMEKDSARRHFFENGGTPSMWRGSKRVFKDRKKETNKYACRDNKEE